MVDKAAKTRAATKKGKRRIWLSYKADVREQGTGNREQGISEQGIASLDP
jgi:hypothetical protein